MKYFWEKLLSLRATQDYLHHRLSLEMKLYAQIDYNPSIYRNSGEGAREIDAGQFHVFTNTDFNWNPIAEGAKFSKSSHIRKTTDWIHKQTEAMNCTQFQDYIRYISEHGFDEQIFDGGAINEAIVTDPKAFFDKNPDKGNYCLKLHLSKEGESIPIYRYNKKENYRETIKAPTPKKKPRKKNECQEVFYKVTLDVLTELFIYWIHAKFPLWHRTLILLKNSLGECSPKKEHYPHRLGTTVNTSTSYGYDNSWQTKMNSLSDFVHEDVLFSKFVQAVRTGSFDTDMIPGFRHHIETNWNKFNEPEKTINYAYCQKHNIPMGKSVRRCTLHIHYRACLTCFEMGHPKTTRKRVKIRNRVKKNKVVIRRAKRTEVTMAVTKVMANEKPMVVARRTRIRRTKKAIRRMTQMRHQMMVKRKMVSLFVVIIFK